MTEENYYSVYWREHIQCWTAGVIFNYWIMNPKLIESFLKLQVREHTNTIFSPIYLN